MIYRFKATFNPLKGFMRQYELRGSDTLYDFHEHIVSDLNFAPDQMVLFRIENSNGKTLKQYGLFDLGSGSMDEISIDTLIKQKETTLLYVFDMRDNRSINLVFMETDDELPRKSYPRTSEEKGNAPSQFVDKQGETSYDDDVAEDIVDAGEINNNFDA